MIVEFKSVRASSKESYEREIQIEIHGIAQVPFEHTEDYIATVYLEMDDVIDFTEGRVYLNGIEKECVYPRLIDEEMTTNIFIEHKDFRDILENSRSMKIKTADEILKSIRNESYPTGI